MSAARGGRSPTGVVLGAVGCAGRHRAAVVAVGRGRRARCSATAGRPSASLSSSARWSGLPPGCPIPPAPGQLAVARMPGLAACTAALGSPGSGGGVPRLAVHATPTGRAHTRGGARWAGTGELRALRSRAHAGNGARLVLGRRGGRLLYAEQRHALVALDRPSRVSRRASPCRRCSNGTGPAVASSIKTDLLAATATRAARLGTVFVFDPFGLASEPVAHVVAATRRRRTWDGALEVAWRLAAAGEVDQRGVEGGDFWAIAAEQRLAPLLYAAASTGAGIDSVVRWAYGQGGRELDQALARATGEAADERELADAHAAYDAVRAFEAQADRTRSSIEATAQALLRAYRFGRVARSARSCEITADRLLDRARDAVPDRRRQGVQAAAADLPGAAVARSSTARTSEPRWPAGGSSCRCSCAWTRRATSRRCRTWPRSHRPRRATTSSWSRSSTTSPRPERATAGRPRPSSTATARGCCCPGVADLETLRYFGGLIGEEEARDLTRTTGAGGTTRSTRAATPAAARPRGAAPAARRSRAAALRPARADTAAAAAVVRGPPPAASGGGTMSGFEPEDGHWDEPERRLRRASRRAAGRSTGAACIPRERWMWFEQLWTDVCDAARALPAGRCARDGGRTSLQVEALAALAAWVHLLRLRRLERPAGQARAAVRPRARRGAAARRRRAVSPRPRPDGVRAPPDRARVPAAARAVSAGAVMRSWPGATLSNSAPTSASTSSTEIRTRCSRRCASPSRSSWMPALDGWLVTSHDARAAGDPRRATLHRRRRAVLDRAGDRTEHAQPRRRRHDRHRAPFVPPFRPLAVRDRFGPLVAEETDRLIDELEPAGRRRAAAVVRGAAGRRDGHARARVGARRGARGARVVRRDRRRRHRDHRGPDGPRHRRRGVRGAARAAARGDPVRRSEPRCSARPRPRRSCQTSEIVSNAAVLLFGGIETTEGMIANAVLALLSRPEQVAPCAPTSTWSTRRSRSRCGSSRPPRWSTATRPTTSSSTASRSARGELVRVSITAANRDPAVFADPDATTWTGRNGGRHLAFAHGPHVCVGIHLARLEARTALRSCCGASRVCGWTPTARPGCAAWCSASRRLFTWSGTDRVTRSG